MSVRKLIVPIVVLVTTITTLQGQQANGRTAAHKLSGREHSTGMIERTTTIISYAKHAGLAKVEMRSTSLLPRALGEVAIQEREDHVEIRAEFSGLQPATRFGPEYLTYVMWAITRDGCAINVGEVILNNMKSALIEIDIAAFGLIVTAEPYFAVSRPSEVVVMESRLAKGLIRHEQFDTKYQLLPRGNYTANVPRSQLRPIVMDSYTPLNLYEARNALWIALWAGADKNAADLFDKAMRLLQRAEAFHAGRSGTNAVATAARESIQTAENARVTALKGRLGRSLSE